jgi:hypothetical protein
MSALAANSKSERKVDSLPPLGFKPVTIGTLVHHSAKSQLETLVTPLSATCQLVFNLRKIQACHNAKYSVKWTFAN